MSNLNNSAHLQKVGLPPGTLLAVGEQRVEHTTVRVMDYTPEQLTEREVDDPAQCVPLADSQSVSWINVTGLHDTDVLLQVGQAFGLGSLVLEDIATTGQRPKIEDRGDYLFVVLKMLYSGAEGEIRSEQVSLVLGRGWLLTFQEVDGDVFDLIRRRIRDAAGRIRTMGADYLFYALLDAIVDHYFLVLDDLGTAVETIQDSLLESGGAREALTDLHRLKRDMVYLRKNLSPVREVVSDLYRGESPLLDAELAPFLRDLYEHVIQVIETVESLRDMAASALEIHMTVVSNRMNEVMKILTLISTIFIPLTFVAGIYGMNFKHMPELDWPYGYAAAWGVMLLLGTGMFLFFRRRRWL